MAVAKAKTKAKVKLKLKRGDTVEVIAGKDKGKRGTIREVLSEKQRVKVSDVNIVKRHMKAGAQGARQAGIVELEAAPCRMGRGFVSRSGPASSSKVGSDGSKQGPPEEYGERCCCLG
jgi:large subunit ribosomal protein L24